MSQDSSEPLPAESPLSEADPKSLDELFSRMDQHITQRTLRSAEAQKIAASVVEALRAQRAAWAQAEATGATRAPRARASTSKTTLGDLGLDI